MCPSTRPKNGQPAPVNARKRCALYTRKSTDKGLEQSFNSLDAQREACEHYIATQADKGWIALATHYDDGGFSGANTERPAFQRLMEDVAAHLVDVVVVYKVDRLSRSLIDFAQFMDRLTKAKVEFVSVTQNFSTADAMGRLTLNMLMSFAEFEREMIAERTRDKMNAARRKGKWTGGTVPLGYRVDDHKLVVVPQEAEQVRYLFDRYFAVRSTRKVAAELNFKGFRPKARKGRDGSTRIAKCWTGTGVTRVLRNPVYAGFTALGDERFPGEHHAIIDVATFERAQRVLDSHTTQEAATHGRNPAYLLRGILDCACCGKPYLPASTRRGDREYRYYRCETRDKEGVAACPGRSLPATAIEDFVLDKLREEIRSRDLATSVHKALQERIDQHRKILAGQRKEIPREIAELAAQNRLLVASLERAHGATVRVIETRIEAKAAQLEDAERRLSEVERQGVALADATELQAWVKAVLTDFDPLWEVMTDENRGRLMRVLVQQVKVNGATGDIAITLADPAACIPDAKAEEEKAPCAQQPVAAG